MAAIIMVAAYSLFEFHDIVFLWKIQAWKDLGLLILTLVANVGLGPDVGIFVAVGLSMLLIVKQSVFPHVIVMGQNDLNQWVDKAKHPLAVQKDGILVVRIEERLYFSNVEIVKDMLHRIETYGSQTAHPTDEKISTKLKCIIIHAANILDMDARSLQVFLEMSQDYQKKGIFICFVKVRPHLKMLLLKTGVIGSLGGNRVFSSISEAIKYVNENIV